MLMWVTPIVVLSTAGFLMLLAIVEWRVKNMHLRAGLRGEIARKLIHIGALVLMVIAPELLRAQELALFLVLVSAILLIGRLTRIISSMHTVRRVSFGEVFFPLGIAVSAFLFLPTLPLAYYAGLIALFADAIAAIVGKRFGRHRYPFFGRHKTFEGTAGFFGVCMCGFLLLGAPIGVPLVVGVALICTIDITLRFGLDNIALPVTAGLVLNAVMSFA